MVWTNLHQRFRTTAGGLLASWLGPKKMIYLHLQVTYWTQSSCRMFHCPNIFEWYCSTWLLDIPGSRKSLAIPQQLFLDLTPRQTSKYLLHKTNSWAKADRPSSLWSLEDRSLSCEQLSIMENVDGWMFFHPSMSQYVSGSIWGTIAILGIKPSNFRGSISLSHGHVDPRK